MNFILSPQARLDLIEIWQFIADDDLDAADRLRDQFYEACHKIAAMPGIGHLREDLADEPLRFWPVHKYLIIYRADAVPMEIVRVLSSRRDLRTLLH